MKFIVVRHGERIDKVNPSWIDSAEHPSDPHLSDDGFKQARLVGEHLKGVENVSHIYASPFTRTLQTATEIADVLDLPLRVEPGLCEWLNPQWYNGEPFHWPPLLESKFTFPRIDTDYELLFTPKHPEDRKAVQARVNEFAHLLAARHGVRGNSACTNDDSTVVLVTHGMIVEQFAVSLTQPTYKFPWVTYCCMTDVVHNGSKSKPFFHLGERVCDVSFMADNLRPIDPTKTAAPASYA